MRNKLLDVSSFMPGMTIRTCAAISFAAVVSLSACSQASDQTKSSGTPANVTLTDAQRQNIRLYTVTQSQFRTTVEASGVVDFDNEQATSVLAPFSGPVARLLVSPGDQVKKGQALATVASPDFAATVSAYRKALATAQTARRVADLDKDLLQHKGVGEREAEQAETDAANAEADRDAALQGLAALNMDPQSIADLRAGKPVERFEASINAPIGGTVVERLITPGELLQAGTSPCFIIANLSRVWVMAQLFGADAQSVSVGDTAQVETGIGAETLSGTVENVASQVDPNTRSVSVRVAVNNPAGTLKKQMYVRAVIQRHQQSTGLLIPASAILRDDENLPFVYVLQKDGSFARVHVTLGTNLGDQYNITGGLNSGDKTVADGAIFLQFTQDQ